MFPPMLASGPGNATISSLGGSIFGEIFSTLLPFGFSPALLLSTSTPIDDNDPIPFCCC